MTLLDITSILQVSSLILEIVSQKLSGLEKIGYIYLYKSIKKDMKKRLEILSEPHQLVVAILVIGGMIGFLTYGIIVHVC